MARAGGKNYRAASDSIQAKNKQALKIAKFVPSKAELSKVMASAKTKVHAWWIKKTPNGQAVYDKALAIIADVRKNR
jgi:hypothetical protein